MEATESRVPSSSVEVVITSKILQSSQWFG